jgi:hypothetical protein
MEGADDVIFMGSDIADFGCPPAVSANGSRVLARGSGI